MMQSILLLALALHVLADELVQVQILYRHGSRYQIHQNWNWDQFADVAGELTPVGMRQHYVLGNWLRQRYVLDTPLLSQQFNENEIRLQSSNLNRTLMSALSDSYGLYPLTTGPNIPDVTDDKLLPPIKGVTTPEGLNKEALPSNFQPIPIHTVPINEDKWIRSFEPDVCPISAQYQEQFLESELANNVSLKAEDLRKQLAEVVSVDPESLSIVDMANYQDTFYCNLWNNQPLPAKFTMDLFNELDKLYSLATAIRLFYTQEAVQLYNTKFNQRVLGYMNDTVHNQGQYKALIYSGHDTTIMLQLVFLNLTSAECLAQAFYGETVTDCIETYPYYASSFIYELYKKDTGEHYVKLLYNGEYYNLCQKGMMECPFEQFQKMLESSYHDYDQECGLVKDSEVYKTPTWAYVTMGVLGGVAVASIIALVVVLLRGKKSVEAEYHEQA